MTRTVFFFFFLFSCLGTEVLAQKSRFITIYGLYQRTMFYNKEERAHKVIINNLPSYTFNYGLFFSQDINRRIGLEYGFLLSRLDQKFEIYAVPGYSGLALRNIKRVSYLKVPVLAEIQLLSGTKNRLSVSAGPQLGIMLAEDGIIPIYNSYTVGVAGDTLIAFDLAEAAGAYRRFTFDIAGNIGWKTKIYKNVFLQLLIRADYSLTDSENKSYSALYQNAIYRDIYHIYSKERPATHNITFGMGAGISFKVR